ncbi:MAG: hypothetical protein HYV09_02440 [Deltaproteobacteria bacterium]|nr:hypothetical protein [Deltaproteobacteria bacterium]
MRPLLFALTVVGCPAACAPHVLSDGAADAPPEGDAADVRSEGGIDAACDAKGVCCCDLDVLQPPVCEHGVPTCKWPYRQISCADSHRLCRYAPGIDDDDAGALERADVASDATTGDAVADVLDDG